MFSGVTNEIAIGRASNTYFFSPEAPIRLKKYLPNARLIALIRNPVDCVYSSYMMDVLRGDRTREDFFGFAKDKFKDYHRGGTIHFDSLKCYRDHFGDRIKVILYDEFADDASKTMKDVYVFLGVDPNVHPEK